MIVSGEWRRDSAMHIHVSILPQTPLPSRLSHNVEQSPMCYTVGLCWLSVLNIAVCTGPSQIPYVSLSTILPPATVSSFSKTKFLFCKLICIISSDKQETFLSALTHAAQFFSKADTVNGR